MLARVSGAALGLLLPSLAAVSVLGVRPEVAVLLSGCAGALVGLRSLSGAPSGGDAPEDHSAHGEPVPVDLALTGEVVALLCPCGEQLPPPPDEDRRDLEAAEAGRYVHAWAGTWTACGLDCGGDVARDSTMDRARVTCRACLRAEAESALRRAEAGGSLADAEAALDAYLAAGGARWPV